MAGINKVILVGNLGRSPEMRAFQNGERMAKFTLATSKQWRDKATNMKKEHVEWHNILAYGHIASICENYAKKGSKIYVEGYIKTDKYKDKNDNNRSITHIVAERLQLLDKREGEENYRDRQSTEEDDSIGNRGFDDDIPF